MLLSMYVCAFFSGAVLALVIRWLWLVLDICSGCVYLTKRFAWSTTHGDSLVQMWREGVKDSIKYRTFIHYKVRDAIIMDKLIYLRLPKLWSKKCWLKLILLLFYYIFITVGDDDGGDNSAGTQKQSTPLLVIFLASYYFTLWPLLSS